MTMQEVKELEKIVESELKKLGFVVGPAPKPFQVILPPGFKR